MTDAPISAPNDMTIKGIDSEGNAPERRISTVSAAMTAYNSMVYAYRNGGRDNRHAEIAGLYAGFPPIPLAEMQKQGLGDMPNVNTRGFESSVNSYVDVWNAVNCASDQWFEIEAEHEEPMEAERRGKVLTKWFNCAIGIWTDPPKNGFYNKTGRYVLESATRDTQMGLFGMGISMWRDPIDFRFTTIPTRNFKVPDDTKITLENCPCVCIEDDMSVSQLWQMTKLPESSGWKKEQIQRLLYLNQSAQGFLDTNRSTYAQWVEWARENESFMITDFLPVPFVHIYCQEFNGEISHICFSTVQPGVKGSTEHKNKNANLDSLPKDDTGFLYDAPKSEWVNSWAQALALFSDNVGPEGRYHGVKGFGDRNYDMCHFANLIFNRVATCAIITNTPIFRSEDEGAKQRLEQTTITPWAIIQPGLNIEQWQLKADIGSMASVFDLGERTRNLNNRKFPVGEKSRNGEAPTATQVNTDTAKEAEFTNLQVMNYRATGLDPLGCEMYRRISVPGKYYPESWGGGRIAKYFREMCEKEGIPEKDLHRIKAIRASRNGGSGSMAIDVMKAEKLLTVATPGKGQFNARMAVATALKGADMAPAFVEPPENIPTEVNRLIVDENNDISDGKVPLALPNDPHEIHVPAHATLGQQLSGIAGQMSQMGVTPENVDDAVLLSAKIGACIEHLTQHVNYMRELRPSRGTKSIYEEQIKASDQVIAALINVLAGLDKDIEAAAQQEEQAQVSPEMMKAQMEIQIMQMKAQVEMELAQMKAEAKLGMDAIKSEAKTQMKMEDHQLKSGIAAQDSVAKQEMTRAEGEETLRINAAKAAQDLEVKAVNDQLDTHKKVVDTAIDLHAAEQKAKEPKTE